MLRQSPNVRLARHTRAMSRCCNYAASINCRGSGGRLAIPAGSARGGTRSQSDRADTSQRGAEGRACSQKKGNKASTQVIIRDLFCKRRRAMLQYGTPDWARPCLARLTPWGFCVGTAGSETHRSRSPQDARTAPICCTLFRRVWTWAGGSLLSIWFFYLQKGAQATKLAGQCRPILISHPF